jgi:hypothetical protein
MPICWPGSIRCESVCSGNRASLTVSNSIVTKAFRVVLPALMVVALLFTLRVVNREQNEWRASRIRSSEPIDEGPNAFTFVFPFGHSPIIQDALALQWPALAVASIIAPVPRLIYNDKNPPPLTSTSYFVLVAAVAGYWFLIGLWIDTRFLKVPRRRHSKFIRGILIAAAVFALPIFLLFLGKDILNAWPHGRQGGYGATVWLALVCLMLFTELGTFRKRSAAL